jgi:hypothetical protein
MFVQNPAPIDFHSGRGMDREFTIEAGSELNEMEAPQNTRRCQLARPIRDRSGMVRFRESLEIVRELENLGRRMLLVRFDDGATTFVFPHEVKAPD